MITKKSAQKSLKHFKKMTVNGFENLSDNGKITGAALLGITIGVASTLLTPVVKSLVAAAPTKKSKAKA